MADTTASPASADAADSSAPVLTTRIDPVIDADGKPGHLPPPVGGDWIRDPDGGLTPANEATAKAAGLDWVY